MSNSRVGERFTQRTCPGSCRVWGSRYKRLWIQYPWTHKLHGLMAEADQSTDNSNAGRNIMPNCANSIQLVAVLVPILHLVLTTASLVVWSMTPFRQRGGSPEKFCDLLWQRQILSPSSLASGTAPFSVMLCGLWQRKTQKAWREKRIETQPAWNTRQEWNFHDERTPKVREVMKTA